MNAAVAAPRTDVAGVPTTGRRHIAGAPAVIVAPWDLLVAPACSA